DAGHRTPAVIGCGNPNITYPYDATGTPATRPGRHRNCRAASSAAPTDSGAETSTRALQTLPVASISTSTSTTPPHNASGGNDAAPTVTGIGVSTSGVATSIGTL